MKKTTIYTYCFFGFANGYAQILILQMDYQKIEKKSENNYILTFNAIIEKDWHLYSQFTADGGSLPLEVFSKSKR
jgi:thiol:disulfide interchange protein DsbD